MTSDLLIDGLPLSSGMGYECNDYEVRVINNSSITLKISIFKKPIDYGNFFYVVIKDKEIIKD